MLCHTLSEIEFSWIIAFMTILTGLVCLILFLLLRLYTQHLNYQNLHDKHKKLLQAYENSRQDNDFQQQLIALIAHDVRSPLHSLTAFLETFMTHPSYFSEEDIQKIGSDIKQRAYAMDNFLESLLTWAQMQRGEFSANIASVPLRALCTDVQAIFKSIAAQKQIQIQIDVPDNLLVKADKQMTHTIFRNLLHNAIKFTPTNGRVTLTAKQEGEQVLISVQDTGVGMDEHTLQKICKQTNYQSNKGTDGERGTGLGLRIACEFVRLQRWRLHIESEQNVGTTFYIRLPHAQNSYSFYPHAHTV